MQWDMTGSEHSF